MKTSHFAIISIFVASILSPAASACDVTAECIALQSAMENFYNNNVASGNFGRVRTIQGAADPIFEGRTVHHFHQDDVDHFLRRRRASIEAVIRQSERSYSETEALIGELKEKWHELKPSQRSELGTKIDEAIRRNHKLGSLINHGLQGPDGGLRGLVGHRNSGDIPEDLRDLFEMSDDLNEKYVSFDRMKMNSSADDMAKVAQVSKEFETLAKSEAAKSRLLATSAARPAEGAKHRLRANWIENDILRTKPNSLGAIGFIKDLAVKAVRVAK